MNSLEPRPITLQDLPELRRNTEAVSRFLQELFQKYLDTIKPIIDPNRVLGKGGGSGGISWNERSLADFRQAYDEFGRAFRMPQEFDKDELAESVNRFEITPWDYPHDAKSERETKRMTITTPAKWVWSYATEYDFARVKRILTGREQGQPEFIHKFVAMALLLKLVLSKCAPVVELLAALRFKVTLQPVPELHNLPVATVEFALPSFRPTDDLILTVSALSGMPTFIELIDVESIGSLEDPIKNAISNLIA